jgi:Mor family transcriptional regulator
MTFCETLKCALHEACGMSESDAVDAASKVIDWGARNGQSGSVHYWPAKFRDMGPKERAEAIRQKFNGSNLHDVCLEFGVSHTTVYRAVRR